MTTTGNKQWAFTEVKRRAAAMGGPCSVYQHKLYSNDFIVRTAEAVPPDVSIWRLVAIFQKDGTQTFTRPCPRDRVPKSEIDPMTIPRPEASPTPEMIEAGARAICRRQNTGECAAICLSHLSVRSTDGKCPEAVAVHGRNVKVALEAALRSPRPEGWRLVSLSDLTEISKLLPPPSITKEGMKFFYADPEAVALFHKTRVAFDAMLARAPAPPATEEW